MLRTIAQNSVNGRFRNEAGPTVPGTVIDETDQNAHQEELVNSIISGGTPLSTDENQLAYMLESLIAESFTSQPYGAGIGDGVEVAIAANDRGVILAGRSSTATANGQLIRSIDHGKTWAVSGANLSGNCLDVANYGKQTSNFLAATDSITQTTRLRRSTDGGVIWSDTAPSTPVNAWRGIWVGPGDGVTNTVLVSSAAGTGRVMRSVDFGSTWTVITSAIADSYDWDRFATDGQGNWVAIDTTAIRIMRSSDDGITWVEATDSPPAGAPDIKDVGYANGKFGFTTGTASSHLWTSDDLGDTWTNVWAQSNLGTIVITRLLTTENMWYGAYLQNFYKSKDFLLWKRIPLPSSAQDFSTFVDADRCGGAFCLIGAPSDATASRRPFVTTKGIY